MTDRQFHLTLGVVAALFLGAAFGYRLVYPHDDPATHPGRLEHFALPGGPEATANLTHYETYAWDFQDGCWRFPHTLERVPAGHRLATGAPLPAADPPPYHPGSPIAPPPKTLGALLAAHRERLAADRKAPDAYTGPGK
jgi:hypothetical protein